MLDTHADRTARTVAEVFAKEREGAFLGKTVQVVPHITDEIKSRIKEATNVLAPDVLICEIGGTIGDIEGQAFVLFWPLQRMGLL